MARLAGKAVLITGGGSGIGLAAARLFLAEGAKVVITGRNKAKLEAAAEELHAPEDLFICRSDLSDPEQTAELIATATGWMGKIDILVANAGVNIKQRQFKDLTQASWRELMDGNLEAAFNCSHAILPQMRQRGEGLIIYVNSISGKRANPLGGIGYIAAKFGLRGLAMGLAAEEKPNGIRVTSIYPGEVNTPLLEKRPEAVSDERKAAMLQPEDVAASVLFVATLPAHVSIPEMVITPANAQYI
ncbi:MAG: SDR family oxidoreductase [Planctomycetia bacterium]|nr:SDR family oxidoreductase [Planctomycetia bacterium]